jgi:hypothetical protein
VRRYTDSTIYQFGQARGASRAPTRIREAIDSGALPYQERNTQEGERLDVIAGIEYGDATLWWLIASASGIGWALQVPPGTRILIPDLQQAKRIF